MIKALNKILEDGRKNSAISYEIGAHILEAIIRKMEADEATIKRLKDSILPVTKGTDK